MNELEPIPAGTDYYTVLGVPRTLDVDARALEEAFYALSRRYHPDRYATADPKVRITSLEASALINRAYKALKTPWERVRYLVELEGGSTASAQPPQDLFEEILDLQESLSDVRQAIMEGEASEALGAHVHAVAKPFREAYAATEARLKSLSDEWDALPDGDSEGRRAVIDKLAALLGDRRYLQRVNDDVDAALLGKPPSREH